MKAIHMKGENNTSSNPRQKGEQHYYLKLEQAESQEFSVIMWK